jgi:hypothetical protein
MTAVTVRPMSMGAISLDGRPTLHRSVSIKIIMISKEVSMVSTIKAISCIYEGGTLLSVKRLLSRRTSAISPGEKGRDIIPALRTGKRVFPPVRQVFVSSEAPTARPGYANKLLNLQY